MTNSQLKEGGVMLVFLPLPLENLPNNKENKK